MVKCQLYVTFLLYFNHDTNWCIWSCIVRGIFECLDEIYDKDFYAQCLHDTNAFHKKCFKIAITFLMLHLSNLKLKKRSRTFLVCKHCCRKPVRTYQLKCRKIWCKSKLKTKCLPKWGAIADIHEQIFGPVLS